jgi:hypothetical protein
VRKTPRFYVTITAIVIVSTVVTYTTSYYWGPGWGYRSVRVSLFKALSLPGTILVVLALLHFRKP